MCVCVCVFSTYIPKQLSKRVPPVCAVIRLSHALPALTQPPYRFRERENKLHFSGHPRTRKIGNLLTHVHIECLAFSNINYLFVCVIFSLHVNVPLVFINSIHLMYFTYIPPVSICIYSPYIYVFYLHVSIQLMYFTERTDPDACILSTFVCLCMYIYIYIQIDACIYELANT